MGSQRAGHDWATFTSLSCECVTGIASMRLWLAVSVPEKCTSGGRRAGQLTAGDRDVDASHLLWSVLGVLRVLMTSFKDAGVTEDQEPQVPDFPSLRFSTRAPNCRSFPTALCRTSDSVVLLLFWNGSGIHGWRWIPFTFSCQEELWLRQEKSQKPFLVLH